MTHINDLSPQARKRVLAADCQGSAKPTPNRKLTTKYAYNGSGLPVSCVSCSARWERWTDTIPAEHPGHHRFEVVL